MKNLVEVEFNTEKIKEREIRIALERFMKNTNLYLSGEIQFEIYEYRSFWYEFFLIKDPLAKIFIHSDFISVDTTEENLPRIKRFFEEFTKTYKIKVKIKVNEEDEYY